MSEIPCEDCLTFIMCKSRLYNRWDSHGRGVKDVARTENCMLLENHLNRATMEEIDACRKLFGLEGVQLREF